MGASGKSAVDLAPSWSPAWISHSAHQDRYPSPSMPERYGGQAQRLRRKAQKGLRRPMRSTGMNVAAFCSSSFSFSPIRSSSSGEPSMCIRMSSRASPKTRTVGIPRCQDAGSSRYDRASHPSRRRAPDPSAPFQNHLAERASVERHLHHRIARSKRCAVPIVQPLTLCTKREHRQGRSFGAPLSMCMSLWTRASIDFNGPASRLFRGGQGCREPNPAAVSAFRLPSLMHPWRCPRRRQSIQHPGVAPGAMMRLLRFPAPGAAGAVHPNLGNHCQA